MKKSSFRAKGIIKGGAALLPLSIFIGMFIGAPTSAAMDKEGAGEFFAVIFSIAAVLFAVGFLINLIRVVLQSNNTFFAITDKRVIKLEGAFGNRFSHYSLKNVGNVFVQGGAFDAKGADGSADIIVAAADFHTDPNGNRVRAKMVVRSLNRAYDAYKLLSEMTEGNNEALRIIAK
ncbi:MAG: hypothetical protein IIW23_01985 [Clostridia bacterium]|nr:hypothetical protein [Clostridia bacterium]